MKIAIQSQGKTPEARIDDRFGRCCYFFVYDTETQTYEVFNNEFKDGGGAGIKVAQFVAEKIEVVVGINIGPNAFSVLSAGNIEIYQGFENKTVKENIDEFLKKKLKKMNSANAGKHSGMNSN